MPPCINLLCSCILYNWLQAYNKSKIWWPSQLNKMINLENNITYICIKYFTGHLISITQGHTICNMFKMWIVKCTGSKSNSYHMKENFWINYFFKKLVAKEFILSKIKAGITVSSHYNSVISNTYIWKLLVIFKIIINKMIHKFPIIQYNPNH